MFRYTEQNSIHLIIFSIFLLFLFLHAEFTFDTTSRLRNPPHNMLVMAQPEPDVVSQNNDSTFNISSKNYVHI